MNEDPEIKDVLSERTIIEFKNNEIVEINEDVVFELIRDIKDPEHPLTIEELDVIRREYVKVTRIEYTGIGINVGYPINVISIVFKPTIPHCSMAGIIGLSIKLLLERFIKGFKIDVRVIEGTHSNWEAISKQLNDKDRVIAASENESLMGIIRECTTRVVLKYYDQIVCDDEIE